MGIDESTPHREVHNVPLSDRSKSVIEPLVSEQWFVKMQTLAKPAIAAAKDGPFALPSERWTKVYFDWLENVHARSHTERSGTHRAC